MWDNNRTRQLRAFARVDGAYLGLLWAAAFIFFMMQFTNPMWEIACLIASVYSLIFTYKRIVKFRVNICEDELPFSKAYIYSLLMIFYATLIQGVVVYVYFKFIDGGSFISAYSDMLNAPEFKNAAKQSGISADEIKDVLNVISNVRPVDITLNIMSMNIFGSIFIGLPIALIAKKEKRN